jgi:hypothetical protein
MKEGEAIIKIYTKKEEIDKIIEKLKKHSFEDYIRTNHYELSLLTKGTNEEELKRIYPRFELIKLIMLRKHKSDYENYDIHYELERGNYALFAIHFEESRKPKIDNAFIANKIFKNFLNAVVKKYGIKMI